MTKERLSGYLKGDGPLVNGDVEEVGDLILEAMKDEEVAMVDGAFEGAFGVLGDKTLIIVREFFSFLDDESMNNYFGGIMLILGLLEGLEVEALVDAMDVMVVDYE
ncbi:hypothetical protein Tco_1484462 [Tanacetum coccineum]